ncbi:MMPL family transporter [Actinoplanes sp. TFC3]|uniref:MMPL family transporter n=1 Tax=Actinoplanes sp. TFC3 TaxID=1710355 RepID=UPI0008311D76|nr:MMPL family transporter [Actinoplanes sp. TFC3]
MSERQKRRGALEAVGRWCFGHPFLVIVLWSAIAASGMVLSGSLLNRLVDGRLPDALESVHAQNLLAGSGPQTEQIVAIVDHVDTAAAPVRSRLDAASADVGRMPEVTGSTNSLSAGVSGGITVPGELRADTVLLTSQVGAEAEATPAVTERLHRLQAELRAAGQPQASVRVGGDAALDLQAGDTFGEDLHRSELLSLPLTMLILVVIFGGIVTACLPVLAAAASATGAFLVLYGFTHLMDVTQNGLTLVTLLALGLSIDYSLLLVSRFREELDAGYVPAEASARATRLAGRTVAYSALTVMVALAGLMAFSFDDLSTLGVAGVSVTFVSLLAALTLTPAMLGVTRRRQYLGSHTMGPDGKPRHHWVNRNLASDLGMFAGLARFVQRHAVIVLLATVAILLTAAAPLATATIKVPRLEALPGDLEPVAVAHELQDRFGANPPAITVVAESPAPFLADWARDWAHDDAVAQVTPARQIDERRSAVSLVLRGAVQDRAARDLVTRVRAHRPAAISSITGEAAVLEDIVTKLREELVTAVAVTVGAMFVLMFAMTGSVVVPLKALVTNLISLGASCGVLVLVFQDGRLAGPLDTLTIGGLDPFTLIIVFTMAFALSMDYEVFLLGRVREYVRGGQKTDVAVRRGLQKTGRIITSAALLMCVVFGCFATARMARIEQLGLGLTVAVFIDATIVRCFALPASMTLMGAWNWWSPAPLRWLHRFVALEEAGEDGPAPRPLTPGPALATEMEMVVK